MSNMYRCVSDSLWPRASHFCSESFSCLAKSRYAIDAMVKISGTEAAVGFSGCGAANTHPEVSSSQAAIVTFINLFMCVIGAQAAVFWRRCACRATAVDEGLTFQGSMAS